MSRLRVRIELNRGGVGVPLDKLASVVQQSQSFFRMLGDDVHIDQSQGDWLGFDFDHESLNFTAEFVGPVSQEQVAEFHAAFDGTTPLRRATIAQFARIADGIGEDEVIGFGLYLNEGEDPGEWRCLSRRDALRIAEEIQMLLGAGQVGQDSQHLPVGGDVSTSARYMFGRRDRSVDAAKLTGAVREVEANLSQRISRLESDVADHSGHIHDLRSKSLEAEHSMGRLLAAVEGFCEQAANRLETVTATAPALSAAAAVGVHRAPVENRSLPEAPSVAEAPFAAEMPSPDMVLKPDVAPQSNIALNQNAALKSDVVSSPDGVLDPNAALKSDLAPKSDVVPNLNAALKSDVALKADVPVKSDLAPKPDVAVKSDPLLLFKRDASLKEMPKPAGESSPSPVASLFTAAAASPLRTVSPVITAAPFKERGPAIWWRSPIVVLVGLGTVVIVLGILLWPTGSSSAGNNQVTSASEPVHKESVTAAPEPTPPVQPASTAPSARAVSGATHVELVASEPSWVSLRTSDGTTLMSGMIEPGKTQSLDIRQAAVLRAGNAGGLTVRANGKSLGPLGPHGAVRDVEFKDGDFKLVPVE